MKKNIHPKYDPVVVVCNTCKTEYHIGSTSGDMKVELCASCHPYYTGKEMIVDTDNLVEKYIKKASLAKKDLISKKQKRLEKKKASAQGTPSLKDMLSQIK